MSKPRLIPKRSIDSGVGSPLPRRNHLRTRDPLPGTALAHEDAAAGGEVVGVETAERPGHLLPGEAADDPDLRPAALAGPGNDFGEAVAVDVPRRHEDAVA